VCDIMFQECCELLFPVYMCVPFCVYILMYKISYLKWLAKVLLYDRPYFFRLHNFHFLDFTLFLILHSVCAGHYRNVK
jgi:hypothetical protein